MNLRLAGALGSFVAVCLLDRITKLVMVNFHSDYAVTPFITLHTVYNRGISCGILHNGNHSIYMILSGIIALFLLFFSWYVAKFLSMKVSIIPAALVLAGGISNLVDRYVYGGVVDFIELHWGTWSFPIFNIADCAIVIGILLLIAYEGYSS